MKGLIKHLKTKTHGLCRTATKLMLNQVKTVSLVPNSVFDDASHSAVSLLILRLVSVLLMSEPFWTLAVCLQLLGLKDFERF